MKNVNSQKTTEARLKPTILDWIFGIIILFLAVSLFATNYVFGGLLFFVLGILLLPPAKGFLYKKWRLVIPKTVKVIIVFVAIAVIVFSNPQVLEEKQIEKDKLFNLAGFQFVNKNEFIYSYTPVGKDGFSVTMAVYDKNLGMHKENYLLEKGIEEIGNISVQVGFQQDDYLEDVKLTIAYESLAFDFEYGNKFYSGEITNLNREPSKDVLLGTLENLVIAVIDSL